MKLGTIFSVAAAVLLLVGCGSSDNEVSLADHLAAQANKTADLADEQADTSTLQTSLAEAVADDAAFDILAQNGTYSDGDTPDDPPLVDSGPEVAPGAETHLTFNQAAVQSIDALVDRLASTSDSLKSLTETVAQDRLTVAKMLRQMRDDLTAEIAKRETLAESVVDVDDSVAPHELLPPDLDEVAADNLQWIAEIVMLEGDVQRLATQAAAYSALVQIANDAAPGLELLAAAFPETKESTDRVLQHARRSAKPKVAATIETPDISYIGEDRVVVLTAAGHPVTIFVGDVRRVGDVDLEIVDTKPSRGTARIKMDGRPATVGLLAS